MIIDKIVMVIVPLILNYLLILRYVKRYAPENLVIVPLLSFFLLLYIIFAVYEICIPIYMQIPIFLFTILVPLVAVYLQYNNIILTRKILYFKMKRYYKQKDYKKTIEYIEKLVMQEGRRASYLYILGNCYKKLGDFINARDSFSLAIELDPNDYKSYYELGLILDETNKKEMAMKMYRNALRIKKDFYEANEALGISLTSQGKFKEAVEVYNNAIKNYPNSYEIYYNIAMIENELGHYDNAIEAFKKSGEIKPDLYTAHYNLGKLYVSRNEYDMAIDAYSKILNSTTYGPRAYYQIAIVYAYKKDYDRAMTSLEYAMELDENYLKQAYNEYAFTPIKDMIDSYKKEKEKQAIKQLQKRNLMWAKIKVFSKNEDISKSEAEKKNDVDLSCKKDYENETEEYEEFLNHA